MGRDVGWMSDDAGTDRLPLHRYRGFLMRLVPGAHPVDGDDPEPYPPPGDPEPPARAGSPAIRECDG